MKNKFISNISWLFIDKIIRILGGLIVGIWVARYLGPKDFGILNYALAYTSLFIIFVKFGLDQIIVREITKHSKLTNYYLGTAFILKLIGSLIAILFIYISLQLVKIDIIVKTVIIFVSIGFLFQAFDVIDYFYQSKILSKYTVIARNSAFILASLLKIFFILNDYNVLYFAFAYSIEFFLSAIFMIYIYKLSGFNVINWKYSKKISIKLIKYSWSLALSTFIISIYTKIDQVMIGNMLNTTQVGIYSVAVRLSEFWMFIPSIIVNTLMPHFIILKENDAKKYDYKLLQLYSLMFWMGVIVGIIILIFGIDIINLLFGNDYIEAYEALILNIWGGIFVSQAIARGIWLISENLQIYRLYNNILSLISNIFLNIILIPKYGISGAAFATMFTQLLGTWFFGLFWKPMRKSTLDLIKSIYLYNFKGYI